MLNNYPGEEIGKIEGIVGELLETVGKCEKGKEFNS